MSETELIEQPLSSATATEVMEEHLRRARTRGEVGLTLDATTARSGAAQADWHRVAQQPLGALHGMPFAFAQDAAVGGWTAPQDELAIGRIREAGVVLLGRLAPGVEGIAAVAAGVLHTALVDDRLDADTLVTRAAARGVPALRPSPGRIPAWPVRNLWEPLVTRGPVAGSVSDLARLLSVVAGPDRRVPGALPEPGASFATPSTTGIAGARIAWSLTVLGSGDEVAPELAMVHEQAGRLLARLGGAVFGAAPDLTGAAEVARVLRAWQRGNHDGIGGAQLAAAQESATALNATMWEFFERFDVLVLPAHDLALSVTGVPVATVPAGVTEHGVPFGLRIVGAPGQDRTVLQMAALVESSSGHQV